MEYKQTFGKFQKLVFEAQPKLVSAWFDQIRSLFGSEKKKIDASLREHGIKASRTSHKIAKGG